MAPAKHQARSVLQVANSDGNRHPNSVRFLLYHQILLMTFLFGVGKVPSSSSLTHSII